MNKKNRLTGSLAAVLLLAALLVFPSSCKSQEPVPSASPSAASPSAAPPSAPPAETASPAPSGSEAPSVPPSDVPYASVEDNIYESKYTLKGVNEEIKGEIYLSVPAVTSEQYSESAAMISDYFENLKDKIAMGFEEELDELAKEENVWGPSASGRSLDMTFRTEYNLGRVLSFYITTVAYTGGAHENTIIDSETFDLQEGARITMDTLFTVGEQEYGKRLKDYLLKQMDERAKQPESPYFEDYPTLVEETFNKENFVLTEEGLRYYFQIYDVAPYAAGSIQFVIPYESLADILNPDYSIS